MDHCWELSCAEESVVLLCSRLGSFWCMQCLGTHRYLGFGGVRGHGGVLSSFWMCEWIWGLQMKSPLEELAGSSISR